MGGLFYNNQMKKGFKEVAFQIGVNMIGQPIYMIHRITEAKDKFGKPYRISDQIITT